MLKGFCVGALVGFIFGSSKQGMKAREKFDGMLNSLLTNEREAEESLKEAGEVVVDMAAKGVSRMRERMSGAEDSGQGGNGNGNKKTEEAGKRNGHSAPHQMDSGERTQKRGGAEPTDKAEKKEAGEVKSEGNTSTDEAGVPMDLAVQLAEALNAKPTAPHTDELEPS